MDDGRFDSLVKALAEGKSRRSVLKGLLGLGGAAMVGSVALEGDTDAAVRKTPTPTPVKCPGQQTNVGGVCTCKVPPAPGPNKCGPACCTGKTTDPYPRPPGHTECCDNACCNGTCLSEEGCCPTNTRAGGLPPTHRICVTTSGARCCPYDSECCSVDGCCDTVCAGGNDGQSFCCAQSNFCPGGSESADRCCAGGTTCCGAGTNENQCVNLSTGGCCATSDCPPPAEGACTVQCVDYQCVGVNCPEGQICCQDECVSSSQYSACPVDPEECCSTSDGYVCCGKSGCCISTHCNEVDGDCCETAEAVCRVEGGCCEAGETCCGGDTCCQPGSCTTAGECCTGGNINCDNECCPSDRCVEGLGCCPEGFLACSGGICCRADLYQCATDGPGCACLPGTEPCGQLAGGCCPEGQCNTDAGICCDEVGTVPCGDGCCLDGLCVNNICTCANGLIRCEGEDACQECCGSDEEQIQNCQVLYGYDLNCVYCPNGICDTTPFNGSLCDTDDTGELGKCDDGFCIPCGGGASAPCEEGNECCSGNCFNGQCTDP